MSLRLKLKLCLLCLILLSVSAALFIALLPFLVSTDAIRLRLARDLSSMTGYNVQLREPPHISVFPYFQARLPQAVLSGNSETQAPLMQAEEIIVTMSLWDALRGHARFAETRLIRPHFTISEPFKISSIFSALARSQGSFGSAVRETQNRLDENAPPAGKSGARAGKTPLFLQPFGHIVIEDGLLTYPAATADGTKIPDEIGNINAEIDWPRLSRAASLSASGLWHGAQTGLDVSADDALLLLSGGASPLRISFNSAKGGITFTGTAQAGQNWAARGRLEARSPGLGQTLSWLKIRPPFGLAFTAPFTWESDLKAKAKAAELSNIILTLGDDASGDSGRGALDISSENGLPHISGSLAFEKLNIRLPAPALLTADARSLPSGLPAPANQAVDMPVFNLLGLDVRLSVTEARFNGEAADNVAASIQMQKNGLIFDIGTMQIFGGSAQSSLRLKSNDDRITELETRFSVNNANFSKLRQAFALCGAPLPPAELTGRADVSLNLQAILPEKAAPPPLPAQKPRAEAERRRKKHKNSKERAEPKPAAAEAMAAARAAEAETAAVPTYSAIFMRDIWPYARGQVSFALNNGRLAHFDMADFIRRVQAGAPFALAQAKSGGTPAYFSFDRLEGQLSVDKGAPAPLSATLIFGRHRLLLQGSADNCGNNLRLSGALDPLSLDSGGQCATLACVRQSLVPALRFSAAGAPFAAKTKQAGAKMPAPAAEKAESAAFIEITPEAAMPPH